MKYIEAKLLNNQNQRKQSYFPTYWEKQQDDIFFAVE